MNSTKSRISLGDKVRLNSGGPDMLVVDIEWGRLVCAYLHNNGVIERSYPAVCLSNQTYSQKD